MQAGSGYNTVIAKHLIPIGSNEASITITGREICPEDYDALVDFIRLIKAQLERKLKAREESGRELA